MQKIQTKLVDDFHNVKITHKYVFLFVHVQTLSFKNACYATNGQTQEKC